MNEKQIDIDNEIEKKLTEEEVRAVIRALLY